MARESLFVSLGVLLEIGWVLQSRYRMVRAEVADALGLIAALEGIVVARRNLAVWAIERYRDGADLADMVHLVAAAKLGRFATFDGGVARYIDADAPVTVETLA